MSMWWRPRGLTLVGIMLALLTAGVRAQVATTQLVDTVYRANGTPASGTVLVIWGAFTTATGASVPAGNTSATLDSSGVLHLSLAPNAGATPTGTYYTVVYHLNDGRTSREYWVVPVSTNPVTIATVRNSVLPASVAMQTVSKQYVDQAIVAAVSGAPLGTTPYVLKTGDTMTGALTLSGDPAAANQASNKHYVDGQVASLSAGVGQKVSLSPSSTQTVTQPAGTTLATNSLNGTLYAQEYVAPPGNNGIANALMSSDCSTTCQVVADASYAGSDQVNVSQVPNRGVVHDVRGGMERDFYLNPHNAAGGRADAGREMQVFTSEDAAAQRALNGRTSPASAGLNIVHSAMAGGNNLFPEDIVTTPPYFKSTYSALKMEGNYNAAGQHVLDEQTINCYGVGDCLMGSRFLVNSGGYRDNADESAHAYDFFIKEDSRVFRGTCASGCSAGATQLVVNVTEGTGTQGEGRFLMDTTGAKTIVAGVLSGGVVSSVPHPTATFTGTSFAVSSFLRFAESVFPQATNMAPGAVTVSVATSGVPSGFATSTSSLPATSGVACVADAKSAGTQGALNLETVNYIVVDGTHVRATFNKPHLAGATFAVGGLCGYGLEQTVDTTGGIRQVFPVVGSLSATQLYYASNVAAVVGNSGTTSAYLSWAGNISTISRSGNVVTVTLSGPMGRDLNGLTLNIASVTDSSFNGSFAVTTTGANTFTYAQTGSNATSSGGGASYLTGGYVLYPMAEVLSVYNGASHSVDGTLTLAANTVNWESGDTVEQPHYYQQNEHMQLESIQQTIPRTTFIEAAGITYSGNVGPGMRGWMVQNAASAGNYFGYGGTHTAPDFALMTNGIWTESMDLQAGERSVLSVHCNLHGCGNWNSSYNLFELDRSTGNYDTVSFAPQTSTLTMNLRGTAYIFSPTSMSLGSLGVGTSTPGAALQVAKSPINTTQAHLAVGDNVAFVTSSNTAKMTVTSSNSDSNVLLGQDATHGLLFAWNYSGTTANAYGVLETYAGNNPLILQRSGNKVGIGTTSPTQLLSVGSSSQFTVDASGNVSAANLRPVLMGVTGSIGGAVLASGACATGTASVTGATVGSPVAVSASDGSSANALVMLSAAVTSSGTVTVQECAVAAVTPVAKAFNVRVIQ